MERLETKSLLLKDDNQINSAISVCVAENVEGFQKCIKEIFMLIEQGGNLSEVNDDMKTKLMPRVAELSRMHSVLADQHVNLIEKVNGNGQSLIKNQHLDCYDSSSPQVTQMFMPDQMSNTQKFRTPIGFDVMSGGSYVSKIEGSESSFSVSSDSDSESFMSINKLLISPVNDDVLKVKETKVPDELFKKISNLEEEIVSLNKKVQTLEDENTKLKNKIQEHELGFETEKAKVFELQTEVADLDLMISDANLKAEIMEKELLGSNEKLIEAEDEIVMLKHELSSKICEETYLLQGQLGSTQQELALLQKKLDSEKDKNLGLQEEVYSCVADISIRNDQITELHTKIDHFMSEISLLKAKEDTWNADFGRLKMEVTEKSFSVNDLNKKLDALMLEKDGLKAQFDTLQAEKISQGHLVQELETRLKSLQTEHVRVLSSFDTAQESTNELRLKVLELEKEVEKQREVILVRAEEKREAIRQLSFSLEHYMSGYKELRQAFVGNKRHVVLTS
ncbi:uncharacterized protein [Rutidosis leptorrhynchoides]|uniref:uncharacterized protein n=1 Tax=Rutidosis leptorrhynchoides TaxID=125765 RepID=UPI003A9A399E